MKDELYIKMCNHPIIQESWKPQEGDRILVDDKVRVIGTFMFGVRKLVVPTNIFRTFVPVFPRMELIPGRTKIGEVTLKTQEFELIKIKALWLPWQEQILKMLNNRHLYYLIKDIQIFQVKHTTLTGIKSMGELILAFYMYRSSGLIWKKGKWRKRNV